MTQEELSNLRDRMRHLADIMSEDHIIRNISVANHPLRKEWDECMLKTRYMTQEQRDFVFEPRDI